MLAIATMAPPEPFSSRRHANRMSLSHERTYIEL
jgi:hypothetical protein